MNVEKYNPFRRPSWRLDRIKELLNQLDGRPALASRHDDTFIRQAKTFIHRYKTVQNQTESRRLCLENPALYYACAIYNANHSDDASLGFTIEARLLAGQTFEEIATKVSTLPDTIMWYERIFFNVLDRLDNQDYILRSVLVPSFSRTVSRNLSDSMSSLTEISDPIGFKKYQRSVQNADLFYDGTLKLFAYFGGAHVLEPFLYNCHIGPKAQSPESANDWINEYWKRGVARKSAQAISRMPINTYNLATLFQMNTMLALRADEVGKGDADTEEAISAQIVELSKSFVQSADFKQTSAFNQRQMIGHAEKRVADQLHGGKLRDIMESLGGREPRPLNSRPTTPTGS